MTSVALREQELALGDSRAFPGLLESQQGVKTCRLYYTPITPSYVQMLSSSKSLPLTLATLACLSVHALRISHGSSKSLGLKCCGDSELGPCT